MKEIECQKAALTIALENAMEKIGGVEGRRNRNEMFLDSSYASSSRVRIGEVIKIITFVVEYYKFIFLSLTCLRTSFRTPHTRDFCKYSPKR